MATTARRTRHEVVTERADGADRALAALATVLTGLMAGFFFAYACSVMLGLARVDDATFVATMQAINATVRNAAFAPAFFGALLVGLVAAGSWLRHRRPGAAWLTAGALLYAAAFVVTMAFAVPLNDELAAAGPVAQIGDPGAVRAAYEDVWVRWNLLRTVLNGAALVCCVVALLSGRRAGR